MNWVGGVRNRLKGSKNDTRKLQKMYFERKQRERTGSALANRCSSEVKTSHRLKKPKVSQDVLAFKMQSEFNSKSDISTGGNFRVVNLGRGKSLAQVKNGVNVAGNRRVDSVFLPLSPMETPSALDLSYSPNGSVLGNAACQSGVITNKTSNMPYVGSKDSNCSVIDLFGVPVEKPVKTQKATSSDESKHKYYVNSNRACRKDSCSMNTVGLMPETAEINQHRDHITNRSNTVSSDHHHTFQFTRPDIFSQSSLKHRATIAGSDNDTCFSEPLVSYSSRSACENWCNRSDTDCNVRQDMRYSPRLATISSGTRLPNTGFNVGTDASSFHVELVNSPKLGGHSRQTLSVSTNIDRDQFECSHTVTDCRTHNAYNSVLNDSFDHPLYADGFIHNDTEFQIVPNKIENIALISSPRSPQKPAFMPYDVHTYSPLASGNIFDKPAGYARNSDTVIVGECSDNGYYGKENHDPLHIWNPERRQVDVYKVLPNTNTESVVYPGNKRNDVMYTCNENYPNYNNHHSTFSNVCSREQQAIPRTESYIISSGLDNASSVGLNSQASSLGWRPVLPSGFHKTSPLRRHSSIASTVENNNKDNISRSGKQQDSNINVKPSRINSKLLASRDSHGLLPTTEAMCYEGHNKTVTVTSENNANSLSNDHLMSVPLMTSTPRYEQNGQQNSNQTNSAESVNRTRDCRRKPQMVSASQVLLEMSMLEKQQAPIERDSPIALLASCTREADLQSSFQGDMQTYSPEPSLNQGTNLTSLFVHDKISATSLLPTIPSINNSTDHFISSQHSENSLLNTPVTGNTNNDSQEKNKKSNDLLAERQASNAHHEEIYPNSYVQSKDKIACKWPLDVHCSESSHEKVSAHNPDVCLPSQTAIVAGSLIKTGDNSQQKISVSSQTTPRFVKDVACSPIQELTQDKPRAEFTAANGTDIPNSKVYCLRSRNKMVQPDIFKDTLITKSLCYHNT